MRRCGKRDMAFAGQQAYEDPADWIIKEGSLPENVDPANSKLKDHEERNRI
ncbi:transglutaminase family protein, partial [Rhizobium ruizarguesonis]